MQTRKLFVTGVVAIGIVGLVFAWVASSSAQAPKNPGGAPATAPRTVQEYSNWQLYYEAQKQAALAERAGTEYHQALEANRLERGTIDDEELDHLRRRHSEELLLATSKQIKHLQTEVDALRAEVKELRQAKIMPLGK